jgi:hypothetical protein
LNALISALVIVEAGRSGGLRSVYASAAPGADTTAIIIATVVVKIGIVPTPVPAQRAILA